MSSKSVLIACLFTLGIHGWAQVPGKAQLVGTGATFPLPVYTQWFQKYEDRHPSCQLHYVAAGSGEGIKQVTSGAVDFGASDAPMTDKQLAEAKVRVLHLPTVIGAAVPVYNLPGPERTLLQFTPQALAGIYLGKITKWNDPAIVGANPGVRLPEAEIRVLHRQDGSGTTYIWTDYLSKVSAEWKTAVGKGTQVSWPTGRGITGNGGLAQAINQTPYSIGYVELTYAMQNHVRYGAVRNAAGNFIEADLESVTAAAASFAETMPADFRVSITNAPGKHSYSIASFTWLLVPERIDDRDKKLLIKELLRWMLTTGQDTSVESLHYARLPAKIVEKELRAVEQIQ